MQIAVLSDIHGNYVALEKCLEYAINRGIETFVFLGDYVGEMAYPQRAMDILYALDKKYQCFFVKGNRDDYQLDYDKGGVNCWKEFDSTTGALYYAYHNLRKKDFEFLEKLSHSREIHFDHCLPLTVCHGSPNKANEKLLPGNENTYEIMRNDANKYILCGHTHEQRKIERDGKVVLNGGSVGVPLGSGGKSQFMIMTGDESAWKEEFVSLEYDVEKVITDLRESGLSEKAPSWCVVTQHLLHAGEVSHGTVLAKAMELCRMETGECKWPEIPEKYWEEAIKEMIIAQQSLQI